MTHATEASPELFFQTLWAYQRTAALKAAIELDLFSAVGDGAATAEAIASAVGASPKGTRVLCDYLTMLGFFTKRDGTYQLTPDSAFFLTRRSPAYLGGTLEFLMSDAIVGNHDQLAAAVRAGGVTDAGNDTVSEENPVWEKFARAMVPMMAMPAQAIAGILGVEGAGPLRVLDIAAGHGLFGVTIAQRNPDAEVVAVDWPGVLKVATEHAQAAGVGGRHRTVPGDAFSVDWGTGYDVALVTNFLHHFDLAACTGLLRKVHASLADNGRVAILEFVPDEDRVGPPLQASFAIAMLAGTKAGDAYTMSEIAAMLGDAGFRDVARHDLQGPQTVIVATR